MSIGTIASQAFAESKLAGLTFNMDASDLSTLTESGGVVSAAADKSSEGNDVSQGVVANRPIIDTINGRTALLFDGVNDSLERTSFTGGVISQPNTIFIVWEIPALPGATSKIIDGGSSLDRHVIELNPSNQWQMWAGAFAIGTIRAINTPYITSSLFNTASSEGYINGALNITGSVSTMAMNGITIGRRFSAIQFLNVKIGQIIVKNGLSSTTERLTVETYLSNKWGIALA